MPPVCNFPPTKPLKPFLALGNRLPGKILIYSTAKYIDLDGKEIGHFLLEPRAVILFDQWSEPSES